MTGYTLDTNIIRPLLKQDTHVPARMTGVITQGYSVQPNAISYYETKRGLLAIGAPKRLAQFDRFCQSYGVIMLDQPGLDKAAEIYADLRRRGMLIEAADLLMAAIALVNDLTLVTNNTAHCSRIPGLRLEDWIVP
jgi:tRNA(fMet)-specific endonuclease VapC